MIQSNLTEAAKTYIDRRDRNTHPDGYFDRRGRWWPDESEERACCTTIRTPSIAHPYSLMTHCRTMKHVAALYNVTLDDLRRAVRGYEKVNFASFEHNQPVLGYRAYRVDPETGLLRSIAFSDFEVHDRILPEAYCRLKMRKNSSSLTVSQEHRSLKSFMQCDCGYHMLKDINSLVFPAPVIAEVSGWGWVAEHDKGYRCQFLKLESIIWPSHHGHLLIADDKYPGWGRFADKFTDNNELIKMKELLEKIAQRYQVPLVIKEVEL